MGEIDLNDLEQFCLLGEEGLEPECAIGRLNLALEGKPESIAIILICLAGDSFGWDPTQSLAPKSCQPFASSWHP